MTGSLRDKRILVVEDSPAVAEATRDMLDELGCIVVGPTGNLGIATGHAEQAALDAAIIDVNIRGWKIFPVARALAARNIPFLFVSGYADTLPDDLADRPTLPKPYDAPKLERALDALFEGAEAGGESKAG